MIDLASFFDELEKISAQKCRCGSMPIRAGNLAKKEKYDGRGKRTTKLAFIPIIRDILGKGAKEGVKGSKLLAAKNVALLGGAGTGGYLLKGEKDKYMLGRRVHEAQNR